MKPLWLCIAVFCAGCGVTPIVPVLNFPINPLVAAVVPMDGQWVLSSITGDRSCLVIQESRVSIFNRTCSNDPSGFVPRIIDSPLISRAGDTIVLTLVYNPGTFSEVRARTTFTGAMSIDATFQGTRVDQLIDPVEGTNFDPRVDEAAALLQDGQPHAAPATLSRL